jgi:hypothetical protein
MEIQNLEQLGNLLVWMFVSAPLLALGAWLNSRGMLRARHLVYRYMPLVLTLSNFVYVTKAGIASTWWARLLLSLFGAASIVFTIFVIWRIAGVDVDELDQKWKKKNADQVEKSPKVKRKRKVKRQ